jgi:co-chaperonin GroES (HSP10)
VNFRPTQDNVLLRLEPLPTKSAGGIELVNMNNRGARQSRTAVVLASGPGYYGRPTYMNPGGLLHPNETKPGDRVIVDALAGHDWSMNLSAPRHHDKPHDFGALPDMPDGEYRVVREDEVLMVIEPEAQAAE